MEEEEECIKYFQYLRGSCRQEGGSIYFPKHLQAVHEATELRSNFPTERTINEWNGLTSEILDAPKLEVFKKRPDNHWSGMA